MQKLPSFEDRAARPNSQGGSLPAELLPPMSGIRPKLGGASNTSLFGAPALVLAVLWTLAALSLELASVHTGRAAELDVLLVVAAFQAGLVATFFMGLTRETRMHWVLLSLAFFLVTLLFCMSLFDRVETRTEELGVQTTGG
jgi:caa(3)-type oxidase subunit IV